MLLSIKMLIKLSVTAVCIALFSADAFAETYTWYMPYLNRTSTTPAELCARLGTVGSYSYILKTETSGNCTQDGKVLTSYSFYRKGDSCPSGTTYNPSTGACDLPPPVPGGQACVGSGQSLTGFGFITNKDGECVDYTRADTASQCKNLEGTSAVHTLYVSFDGDGNPVTPPPINAGGCKAVAATVGHCTMAPARTFPTGGSIQSTINKCKVLVSFSGETIGSAPVSPPISSSSDSPGVCPPGEDCPDVPDAPVANNSQPCTYTEDGEGRRVCSSNNFNYQPGSTSCGSVNGQFVCVGKAPTTNGITIDTVIKDTVNADGSKTSVKTDTATQIVCNSPKPCVSNTTTTTTTTNYNSNGAQTGQTSSCTGSACSSSGSGKGNCEPGQECSTEDEESFEGAELADAPGFGESLEGFMADVRSAPLIAGVSSITVPKGGSCAFQPMVVPILGTLSLQPMCTWAADWFAPLRYLMLAIWAIVAVRTFMEA